MTSFTCSDVDQLFLLIYISIVNAWKGYHILRNLFTFEEIWVIIAVFAVLFLFIIYLFIYCSSSLALCVMQFSQVFFTSSGSYVSMYLYFV